MRCQQRQWEGGGGGSGTRANAAREAAASWAQSTRKPIRGPGPQQPLPFGARAPRIVGGSGPPWAPNASQSAIRGPSSPNRRGIGAHAPRIVRESGPTGPECDLGPRLPDWLGRNVVALETHNAYVIVHTNHIPIAYANTRVSCISRRIACHGLAENTQLRNFSKAPLHNGMSTTTWNLSNSAMRLLPR